MIDSGAVALNFRAKTAVQRSLPGSPDALEVSLPAACREAARARQGPKLLARSLRKVLHLLRHCVTSERVDGTHLRVTGGGEVAVDAILHEELGQSNLLGYALPLAEAKFVELGVRDEVVLRTLLQDRQDLRVHLCRSDASRSTLTYPRRPWCSRHG